MGWEENIAQVLDLALKLGNAMLERVPLVPHCLLLLAVATANLFLVEVVLPTEGRDLRAIILPMRWQDARAHTQPVSPVAADSGRGRAWRASSPAPFPPPSRLRAWLRLAGIIARPSPTHLLERLATESVVKPHAALVPVPALKGPRRVIAVGVGVPDLPGHTLSGQTRERD